MDLSALDPTRDPERWRGVVEATLARVDAVLQERRRPGDPLTLIASWARPLLAAAAVVVAVLIPVELSLERREGRVEPVRRLATLSADWAQGEARPTGADLLRALEGRRPR